MACFQRDDPSETKRFRLPFKISDNFFHNWEHASHVTMSAQKLLKRVLIADHERDGGGNSITVKLLEEDCNNIFVVESVKQAKLLSTIIETTGKKFPPQLHRRLCESRVDRRRCARR